MSDLQIQSKLIDFKSNECIGVICINGETSVPLSLGKAKELDIEDIDIIKFLGVETIEVAVSPKRPEFFAPVSSSLGEMPNFEDVPYERLGTLFQPLDCKEVIWGTIFDFLSFLELDNELAIRRALSDAERI